MQELKISTGLVTYRLNDACEITINPTDSLFIEKMYTVFDDLDAKQDNYRVQISKAGANKAVFDIAREANKELRDMLNEVFGFDICDAVFGEVSVYALADGVPLWANLLLALLDAIDESVSGELKKTSNRMLKYTSKYHK